MTVAIALAIFLAIILTILLVFTESRKEDALDRTGDMKFIHSLLKKANEKLLVKDYHGCVAVADLILSITPEFAPALITRANGLSALNFNLDAIDDFEKALSLGDSDAVTVGLLGFSYKKIGEIEKGQQLLKRSIDMGFKGYEMAYNLQESVSDDVTKILVEKARQPENLKRRIDDDIIGDFSEVDRDELNNLIGQGLTQISWLISQDPDNNELKSLLRNLKEQVDRQPDLKD
ncbi:MAG: hypothetical protein R2813_05355 [Flavobacteriales bacterium]